MEHENIENDEKQENQEVTGAAAPESSSEKQAVGTTKKSESGDNTSIHSREKEKDEEEKKLEKKSPERDEEDMESQNSDDTGVQEDTTTRRNNFICFKPLMYYNRHLDRYYYFRYFKPYKYDHRLLAMGHDCGCQPRRLHKTCCSWYDSDNIYIIDSHADLSISEKAA